jgi:transketolase
VELGKARQVRPGDDAVIFATGGILGEALEAADLLATEGISVRVVDVHTIKPLDAEMICDAASACGRVLTLEEHSVIGGLGGAIAEACLEGGVALKVFRRMGLADLFPEIVGDQAYLRRHLGIDAQAVSAALRDMLAR